LEASAHTVLFNAQVAADSMELSHLWKVTSDTYKFHEVRIETDFDDFPAMMSKKCTLEFMVTWDEVPTDARPVGKRILGGTWVHKRKCAPDGKNFKHKTQYCVC
jgi:hypothetical protein